jgi:hypothetical protein
VTWNCGIPVVTACARRGPAASDVVRTQHGPASPHPYQRSAPGLFSSIASATCIKSTAGDRCEPLGSAGLWINVDQAGPLSGPVGLDQWASGPHRSSTRASRRTARPQLMPVGRGYCRSAARTRMSPGAAAGPCRRSAPCSGDADGPHEIHGGGQPHGPVGNGEARHRGRQCLPAQSPSTPAALVMR